MLQGGPPATASVAWKKAPPELIAAFERAFPPAKSAERRQMFGYPCGFVNGNLFGGIFADTVMVRLPEDARLAGAKPFMPMPGRPMKGYVELPRTAIEKPAQLRKWLAEAHAYTATLPAKPAKRKTAAKR